MSLSNEASQEFEGNPTIRDLSGRGHAVGLDSPFTFGALRVYNAGGKLDAKTEKYLIQCDFIDASRNLTEDGRQLLELHTLRGDKPYIWSDDMVRAAQKAPKLVPQAA